MARTPRLLVTVFLLAFAAGALLVPTPETEATGIFRCGTEIWYWNSDFTEIVGLRAWLPEPCGCQFYGSGSISAYKTYDKGVC
jgi:hypothetical protein